MKTKTVVEKRSLWILEGIGSMIGFGYFFEALILSIVTLSILIVIGLVEDKFPGLCGGPYSRNNGHSHKGKKDL